MNMEENIIETIQELVKNKKISKLREVLEEINSADFPTLFEELNEEDYYLKQRLQRYL